MSNSIIRRTIINLFCIICFFHAAAANGSIDKTSLSGKITDKITKEPIIGAIIYLPDLKAGAASKIDGTYIIENLPTIKTLVQVKFLGYTTITKTIDLSTVTVIDFEMEPSAIEGTEVVVTGSAISSDNAKSSVSVVVVDKNKMISTTSTNIVDAISNTPGVSQITTGGAISKPVIRGLSYNRIITLHNGIRQEGQQWGDEHGIEIDEFSADRIEVLRGPSSLLYGSDAMGGVINILEPFPAPPGKIQGEARINYATNNGLSGNSLMLEGNRNTIIWRLRGSCKNASAYKTPTETVYNSGFNETDYSAMMGVNKSWGYSHLYFSRFESNVGLIEGERDSLTQKFIDAHGNLVSDEDLRNRKIYLPNQNIGHTKLSLSNRFVVGQSQLTVNTAYQVNDRKEFSIIQTEPDISLHSGTFTYDVKYYLPEKKQWETVFGMGGMSQFNQNKGNEFLIPDYHLLDAGVFIYTKKTWDKTTFNMGIRADNRTVKGEKLFLDSLGTLSETGTDTIFNSFGSSFSAVTGAIGATYRFNTIFNFKANVSRGYRAPNIAELASNGVHEGTFRYEIGNTLLKPETSFQIDGTIEAEAKKFSSDISIYYNHISDFICAKQTNNETIMINSNVLPVFRFTQANAALKGIDASVDFHPIEALHFENTFSFVLGKNLETKQPLPYIPAIRVCNEFRWNFKQEKDMRIKEPYIKVSIDNYLKQDKIDNFETVTGGYSLINAGIGTGIKIKNQLLFVCLNMNNITDTKYYNHLSRLKPMGIYNMGRNFSFSLNVPFGII